MSSNFVTNSILVYAATGLIAMTAIGITVPSAFPAAGLACKRIFGLRPSVFPSASVRSPLSNPLHRNRILLLLASAVALIIESLNGITLMAQLAANPRDVHWFLYQLLRCAGALFAGPVFTLAMGHRIIVIVAHDAQMQARFLRVATFLALLCLTPTVTTAIESYKLASKGATAEEWMAGNFIPNWLGGFLAIIPMAILLGSLWSLRIAGIHLQASHVAASHSSDPSPRTSMHRKSSITSTHSGQQQLATASSLVPYVGVPKTAAAGVALAVPGSIPEPPNSPPTSTLDPGSTGFAAAVRRNTFQFTHKSSTASTTTIVPQSIIYPLTRTFMILSAGNLLIWGLFSLVLIHHDDYPFVKNSSLSDVLMSLAVLDEACFAWVLKSSARMQRAAVTAPYRAMSGRGKGLLV
ncbi:hypothetical protein BC828DRAFT_291115 [Blastocladiella britannica]|nr:hypothetical protein BC828DRAFT_291115 [Blastocladiella britannica]